MRLICVCIVLCVGSGLVTGLSLVQGVCVKNDYRTEEEARAQQGLYSHWKKNKIMRPVCSCVNVGNTEYMFSSHQRALF
jgi:hypothetical protein